MYDQNQPQYPQQQYPAQQQYPPQQYPPQQPAQQQYPPQQYQQQPTAGGAKPLRPSAGFGGVGANWKPQYGPKLSFFKDGIKFISPGEKRQLFGRILPAHNPALKPEDPSWSTSWIPYRYPEDDQVNRDAVRNMPQLTAWSGVFIGYKMFGELKLDIVSPITNEVWQLSHDPRVVACPLQDIRRAVKKLGPNYEHLLKGSGPRTGARVPAWSRMYFSNTYSTRESQGQALENQLAIVKEAGMVDLASRLALYTPGHEQPRDKDFPRYLYGDITNPQTGPWFFTQVVPVGSVTATTFSFSRLQQSNADVRPFAVGPEVLQQRLPLNTSILNIRTYQEIVELLVEDGTVPYELIASYCSWNANVPPQPKRGSVVSPPPPQGAPAWQQPPQQQQFTPPPQGAPAWQPPQQQQFTPPPQGAPAWQPPQQPAQPQFTPPPPQGAPAWQPPQQQFTPPPQPQQQFTPPPQPQQQFTPPPQPQQQFTPPPQPQQQFTPPPQPQQQGAPNVTPGLNVSDDVPMTHATDVKRYWVTPYKQDQTAPVLLTLAELAAVVAAGAQPQIMPEDKSSNWAPVTSVITAPTQPTVQQPPVGQTTGQLQPLSAEELQELNAIKQEIQTGTSSALDPQKLIRMRALHDRALAHKQS